jgi:hypothetical protein
MRFITLNSKDTDHPIYINVAAIVAIQPLRNTDSVRISTNEARAFFVVTNSVSEIFEQLGEATRVEIDGVRSTDIDFEGV